MRSIAAALVVFSGTLLLGLVTQADAAYQAVKGNQLHSTSADAASVLGWFLVLAGLAAFVLDTGERRRSREPSGPGTPSGGPPT
jgi:hypothetical protein